MNPDIIALAVYEPIVTQTVTLLATVLEGRNVKERYKIATDLLRAKYTEYHDRWSTLSNVLVDIAADEELLADQRVEQIKKAYYKCNIDRHQHTVHMLNLETASLEKELDAILAIIEALPKEAKEELTYVEYIECLARDIEVETQAQLTGLSAKTIHIATNLSIPLDKDLPVASFGATIIENAIGTNLVQKLIEVDNVNPPSLTK